MTASQSNEQQGEVFLTTRQMVAEIRRDVKDLVDLKNKILGALAVLGSGTAVAMFLAIIK
jgi:hypothetical protein